MDVGKPKMMIVDDIEINRIILYELFQEEYEIIEAGNGQEALRLMKENLQDLRVVLLDVVMPVMDGITALQEMDRHEWLDSIPVILITVENSDDTALKGYQLPRHQRGRDVSA